MGRSRYMTAGLLQELDELTRAVEDDPSVGAVILTGTPDTGRFITQE